MALLDMEAIGGKGLSRRPGTPPCTLVGAIFMFVMVYVCMEVFVAPAYHFHALNGGSVPFRNMVRPSVPPEGKCKRIYIDMGSNIGVQIRKIYEPEKFPLGTMMPLFNNIFGEDRKDVCSFGFEPNPYHGPELKTIEDAYRKMGWDVTFFTQTAVWSVDGTKDFHFSTNPDNVVEAGEENMGATLLANVTDDGQVTKVTTVDMSRFVLDLVNKYKPTTIHVKMDIEGAEYEVLPHMLATRALCNIDVLTIEWHDRKLAVYRAKTGDTSNGFVKFDKDTFPGMVARSLCKTNIIDVDDESYWNKHITHIPLPTTNSPMTA